MKYKQYSIGSEAAIEIAKSEWWKGKNSKEIAAIQLSTEELIMDFSMFHEAVEDALDRPVFTHEFGMNYEGLCKELEGIGDAPTFEDIIKMLPAKKVMIVER